MKLRMILMVTLLSTLAISSQGKILKSLLKKKLSLLPSLGRPTSSNQNTIAVTPTRPPISFQNGPASAVQTDSTIISPLSGSIQHEVVHAVPVSVQRYSYVPVEHRIPAEIRNTVYVRESRPVIRRTVFVEPQRNNLGPLPGIIGNLPGLGSIPGLGNIVGSLSGLKSRIGNALSAPSTTPVAPIPARVTTYDYVAYPGY